VAKQRNEGLQGPEDQVFVLSPSAPTVLKYSQITKLLPHKPNQIPYRALRNRLISHINDKDLDTFSLGSHPPKLASYCQEVCSHRQTSFLHSSGSPRTQSYKFLIWRRNPRFRFRGLQMRLSVASIYHL
jgi:hypothetical protein